jgi:hypothetical protein
MRYKIFGRRTGLRVFELALGAGKFVTRWGNGAERTEAKNVFDAYVEEVVASPTEVAKSMERELFQRTFNGRLRAAATM